MCLKVSYVEIDNVKLSKVFIEIVVIDDKKTPTLEKKCCKFYLFFLFDKNVIVPR